MSGPGPLRARRIVVTRGTDKRDRLPALLGAAGATVLHVPLITTVRLLGDDQLRDALSRLRAAPVTGEGGRRWLVLSSEVAAGLVLEAVGGDGLRGLSAAVVGPVTAAALESGGVTPDLVAPGQLADSLADELCTRDSACWAVLVVAAAGGRTVVADRLSAAGALVEVVEAYRSAIPPGAEGRLREALRTPLPDAITFTSGSTVRHCSVALGAGAPPPVPALCIGPVTAQAARDAGWRTVLSAAEHTAAGICAVAVTFLGATQPLP